MSLLRKLFMVFAIGAVLGLMPAEYSPVKRQGVSLTSQLKNVAFTAGVLNPETPRESLSRKANKALDKAHLWVFGH